MAIFAILAIGAARPADGQTDRSPMAAALPAGSPVEQSAAEALTQDGTTAAALIGVDVAEAQRRVRLQEASVSATDRLRGAYRDRLAGIAIEQRPDFRIVVLLTGDDTLPDQVISTEAGDVPVTFRIGAAATLDELAPALTTQQAAIRAALAHPPGMGIDERTGEMVIVVAASDLAAEGADALTKRLGAIAGVPVRVRSIDGPSADQVAEGGARLVGSIAGDSHRYLCTAGFAVTDGERSAIATAAHCPDTLSYVDARGGEHPMRFVGQWGWGYQDVQINLADQPLAPAFFADTARSISRPVLGTRGVATMRAGDIVCHRGERTGYSCGTVELTHFAPAGDLCGGACSPTWTTVTGPQCGGGDSGSPVFVGTTALGMLKGGSYRADGACSFYFYMSTDYLPAGWRLLMASAPQGLPPPAAPATIAPSPGGLER